MVILLLNRTYYRLDGTTVEPQDLSSSRLYISPTSDPNGVGGKQHCSLLRHTMFCQVS